MIRRDPQLLGALLMLASSVFILYFVCLDEPGGRYVVDAKPLDVEVEEPTVLFSLLVSAPTNLAERQAVRVSWAQHQSPTRHRYGFFIGVHGLSPELHANLTAENEKHADLVLLPDISESFGKLTAKVLAAMTWIDRHPTLRPRYIFKASPSSLTFWGDDDTFLRVEQMIDELLARPESTSYYWGYFDGRAPVKRSGKYAEMNWNLCDHYLPYALGGGYVLSRDLVAFIALMGPQFRTFNNEDVSVGLWLSPLNITRRHDQRFDTEWKSRGCLDEYIVLHKRSPADMYELRLKVSQCW
ncbi:uncharacterized protein MONBRDRAFT_23896 [Monosiga brevicollis MX1]|uniref:Hexosyltransferase n=1 Tax=Monosiga brevicollis TaxID=81824 RepID=A9UV58_MONBE|nr:uncharacterized protein MONBRDRAFT_23896 [Monosiga brevicollis MX1]EDQ91024.1 predicted protein [Monosiga brevicollis MX1]|eukprot:XP_001744321.1 hypothetical protein [Monosiga brevicollis MX1]